MKHDQHDHPRQMNMLGCGTVAAAAIVVVLLVLFILALAQQAKAQERDVVLSTSQIRVIDGDTFAVGETRFRLWGIDAPEMDTAAGKRSATALQAALNTTTRILCQDTGDTSYGRIVLRCDPLSCAMVAAGMARDWPKYSGGLYQQCVGMFQ